MAQCFCGCGRKVKFTQRSINTRGRQMQQRFGEADRTLNVVEGNSETLWRFLAEGMVIMDQLAEGIHGGSNPGDDLEAWSRDWQRQGRAIGSDPVGAVALAYQRQGLTSEEAARKLVDHDYGDDLFAFTVEARALPPDRGLLDPMVDGMKLDLAKRNAAEAQ